MKKNIFPSPQTQLTIKRSQKNFTQFFFPGLYVTRISVIESYSINIPKVTNPKLFFPWHERLGHLGISMMRRIIEDFIGDPFKTQKVIPQDELSCSLCFLRKLIV